jgi:hypothetical protein
MTKWWLSDAWRPLVILERTVLVDTGSKILIVSIIRRNEKGRFRIKRHRQLL